MRVIEKKVYYCDFCKTHKLSAGGMKNHERGCTINPGRKCGISWCGATPDEALIKETTEYIVNDLQKSGDIDGDFMYAGIPTEYIKGLVDKTECAVCTLAIVRLARKAAMDEGVSYVTWEWSFKDEAKRLFDEQNEMARESYHMGYGYEGY